ncbi:MAG: CHASE3 domain-containing protein, partial [Kiritimatiellaeota bacterium]|nr:CHASE3 domain-containing protein [Kiritimatiellota bacterium]
MKIEISLSRKIGLGFAAGLLVLIFVGIVSFLSTQHFTRAAAMVAQSHQVMMLLEATLGDVVTAESESRGFILAGDVSFLKVYEQNVMDTAEDLQQLHLLVIDRNIHEKLNEFEQLIKARLTRIEYFVELRKAQGFGDVFTSGLNIGKQMMDNLRKVTDEVEDMERHLIVEREQRMQALAR